MGYKLKHTSNVSLIFSFGVLSYPEKSANNLWCLIWNTLYVIYTLIMDLALYIFFSNSTGFSFYNKFLFTSWHAAMQSVHPKCDKTMGVTNYCHLYTDHMYWPYMEKEVHAFYLYGSSGHYGSLNCKNKWWRWNVKLFMVLTEIEKWGTGMNWFWLLL